MNKIDLLHGDCLELMKDIPEEIKEEQVDERD